MTPTPPSTNSPSTGNQSTGNYSPDTQFRVVRKRNRVPLSCAPCRHRKLKCNRSNPCENCVRRGDASSCSYAAPGIRKKNQSQAASSPDDMQNRIDRLEGLVLSLMTNGAQSAGPIAAAAAISRSQSDSTGSSFPHEQDHDDDAMIKDELDDDSEVDGVTNSLGVLKVDADKGKTLYFGDSHWHMILADITEVKNYFTQHKKDLEKKYEKIQQSKPESAIDGPAFLFNKTSATDIEIRSELPPKSVVEKLVARYFTSNHPAIHVLHCPTFHKNLQEHWKDPSKTSMVWLGLLYSILCLAMQSYQKIGDEPPEWKGRTMELATEYRMRTVQCLINCDYTKSSIYTIETLIFYVQGEYEFRQDAEVGLYVMLGILVRLSMRMGYHRDPSNYPGVTPYQIEMRRRIWAYVRQLDTLFSFQLALPGMIRDSDCDTALPRNIFENEFGPDSKVIPPSRPTSEPTPISYIITKSSITAEFGAILEEVNAVGNRSVNYDDILKRDNTLRNLKLNMPYHLRLRPLEDCGQDPAYLLMQRFNLDIMWQKTMCILHRKYISRARTNSRYAHSRRACVDASMEILRHQAKLHQESQPGGRLRTMKWFISSLTKNDYLLAAMIVCLDLNYDSISDSMSDRPPNYDPYFWTPAQRKAMVEALESSLSIWKGSSDSSMEAFKASGILETMLEKLKFPRSIATALDPQLQSHPQQKQPAQPTTTAEVFAAIDEANLHPEHSAAMTLGMLSTGGLSPNTAALFNSATSTVQSPGGPRYGNSDMSMGEAGGPTGLTPGYNIEMNTNPFGTAGAAVGMNGAASPFSTVFGGAGMMDAPINLDWEAWDSYIQNGAMIDTSFPYYPTSSVDPSLDPIIHDGLPNPSQQTQQQSQQQNQQPQQEQARYPLPTGGTGQEAGGSTAGGVSGETAGVYGSGVFMGANTPGKYGYGK